MATSTADWIEELKGISVLELSERIKALEEEFGVSATAVAAAAPAAGGGGGDGAAAEEEQTAVRRRPDRAPATRRSRSSRSSARRPAWASRRPRRSSTRPRSPSRRASRRTRPTSSRPSSRRPAAPSRSSSDGPPSRCTRKGAHRGALPFGVFVRSAHKDCAKMKLRVRTLDKAVRMGEGRGRWRDWPPGHWPRSASATAAR